MSIAIDNFIDVSLTKKDAPISTNLVYDTVVYVGTENKKYGYVSATSIDGEGTKAKPYTVAQINDATFTAWATLYFNNGGKFIHYVKELNNSTITLIDESSVNILTYTDDKNTTAVELPLSEVLITNYSSIASNLVGVRQKIWLKEVNTTDKVSSALEGLVTMYKPDSTDAESTSAGSTAYIAAYYSKLRASNRDSVKDLAFTAVQVPSNTKDIDNNTLTTALQNHHNVVSYLAGNYRILGGDDSKGNDVTNLFMRIVMQQAIYVALANLIVIKLRLNTSGINKVKAAIAATLNTYIANGYISLDKVWQEDDLYIDDELVAVKDNPLPGGYAIHVAPITQDNITNHQIPNIYILYGDQVGVRKIVISGEVF